MSNLVNENDWEIFTDGFWNDTDTAVLEEDKNLTGGWWDWIVETLQERVDRIEAFLRSHNFIYINSLGNEEGAKYPW